MGNMIWLEGTKNEIAVQLAEKANLPEHVICSEEYQALVSVFVDFLVKYQDVVLSDEEEFQIDSSHRNTDRPGLVTPNARYFIGLKRSTYLLSFAAAKGLASLKGVNPIVSNIAFDTVKELLPKEDMALFKELDQAMGESCIVLEALRNRKKGINKNDFPPRKGECINNQLNCRLQQGGQCGCSREMAEKICQDLCRKKILEERKGRCFYTDFI